MLPAEKSKNAKLLSVKLINLVLLTLAMALGVACYFALLELLLAIGARVLVETVESSVQRHYSLVSLRNLWMIGGGVLLVIFVIGLPGYLSKRMGERRSSKLLLITLLAQALIVFLAALAGA